MLAQGNTRMATNPTLVDTIRSNMTTVTREAPNVLECTPFGSNQLTPPPARNAGTREDNSNSTIKGSSYNGQRRHPIAMSITLNQPSIPAIKLSASISQLNMQQSSQHLWKKFSLLIKDSKSVLEMWIMYKNSAKTLNQL